MSNYCDTCGVEIPEGHIKCMDCAMNDPLNAEEQSYPCNTCKYGTTCTKTECNEWKEWFEYRWAEVVKPFKKD